MEDLLANERATEQHVHDLLKDPNEPIVSLVQAFDEYRQASQACLFAVGIEDGSAAKKEAALWQAHTEGNKYFRRTLSPLRKQAEDRPVELRQLVKLYLQFIKDSVTFYRGHIYKLSESFGGIPELEAVAHNLKHATSGESSQLANSPVLRKTVLDSCHHALICLGDLSRYRAAEKLDRNPEYGPAIGYYGLACTLRPSSGMGHHQQAVIALGQGEHLRAIYHLYRATVVEEPHPNAVNNLQLEFQKTNQAWDRGELIQKGPPNDPDVSKRTLVGWFVRLHSMCYKGEPFRGYDELEREVLGQLGAVLKQRDLAGTMMRMVMINLAAQYTSAESFQATHTEKAQNAFLHFFRFNIKTFTTMLRIFFDDLQTVEVTTGDDEDAAHLATRLTVVVRHVLPALRLYSSWLLSMTHLLDGLSEDDLLKDAIAQFWPIYAKAVDLVAAVFPIWDLEELEDVNYTLEEDTETLGFKPLLHARSNKIWYEKATGTAKPRFSDMGTKRASAEAEMLARIKEFLVDGLFLANDDDKAPIKLSESRILHRDANDVTPPVLPVLKQTTVAKDQSKPKSVSAPQQRPFSYAEAAANGPVKVPAPNSAPNGISPLSSTSRHAQLSRMVDDLVDDDDGNNPVTPPQQHASHPAVVTRGDVSYSAIPGSTQDFARMPTYSYNPKPIGSPSAAPVLRTPKAASASNAMMGLQSVSSLWNDSPSSHFPVGLPTGTLSSPARGHSRVNSASSIRSRASQNMIAESWSSLESSTMAPRVGGFSAAGLNGLEESANVASPLLFGAGGGLWSTGPPSGGQAFRNVTPPNGQGG